MAYDITDERDRQGLKANHTCTTVADFLRRVQAQETGFPCTLPVNVRLMLLHRISAQYILNHNDGFYKVSEVRKARNFLDSTEGLARQAEATEEGKPDWAY